MKKIVLQQYQSIVDKATDQTASISMPEEGWIKTMRKALGMSGTQLARRMGVSRAQISQSERNELAGRITLKTLQSAADAMGGRLVYTFVPYGKIEALVASRAREKAKQLVKRTNVQMALEGQSLDADRLRFEVERIEQELLTTMPADLWDDV